MKALLLAAMGSVHRQHNVANIFALQQLGYEVTLAANFFSNEPREKQNAVFVSNCKEKGIKIIQIQFKRGGFISNLKYIPTVKRIIKEGDFRIIHAHTETGGLILRLALSAKGDSRYIYTPHGMSFWKGSSIKSQLIYRPIERWICSGMDMNLGMNQEEVDVLRRWNNKTAACVHGIGLNLNRFQKEGRERSDVRAEFGVKEEDKLIVSVGELDDNKNHATVIKALAILKQASFKYVICGVGPNKDMLTKMAAEAGLPDKVILAGYRSDIPDILHAADLFVFPSFHEGMPVSALEAMACGLPLICSSIRGNVDIINDGDNGFLFKPTEVKKLAERISYLLDRKDERKRMGERNRVLVQQYSMEKVTNELQCIYSSFN